MVNYLVLTGCNPETIISKDTQSPNYNQIHVDIISTLALEITIVHISRKDCKIIFTETGFSNESISDGKSNMTLSPFPLKCLSVVSELQTWRQGQSTRGIVPHPVKFFAYTFKNNVFQIFTNVKCQTTDKNSGTCNEISQINCLSIGNAKRNPRETFPKFVISFHHVFLENIFMMTER